MLLHGFDWTKKMVLWLQGCYSEFDWTLKRRWFFAIKVVTMNLIGRWSADDLLQSRLSPWIWLDVEVQMILCHQGCHHEFDWTLKCRWFFAIKVAVMCCYLPISQPALMTVSIDQLLVQKRTTGVGDCGLLQKSLLVVKAYNCVGSVRKCTWKSSWCITQWYWFTGNSQNILFP